MATYYLNVVVLVRAGKGDIPKDFPFRDREPCAVMAAEVLTAGRVITASAEGAFVSRRL